MDRRASAQNNGFQSTKFEWVEGGIVRAENKGVRGAEKGRVRKSGYERSSIWNP